MLFVLLSFPAEASKLRLLVNVRRGQTTITEYCQCPTRDDPNRHARWVSITKTAPGFIGIRISGGTPPYRIYRNDQEIQPYGRYTSADIGSHLITVIDAQGQEVSRSIQVGTTKRFQRTPCPFQRPVDGEQSPEVTPTEKKERAEAMKAAQHDAVLPKPQRERVISQEDVRERSKSTPPPQPQPVVVERAPVKR